MSCLLDCWELAEIGPPPNSIEFIPPPPLPAFLQRAPPIDAILDHVKNGNASTSPCLEQLCDRWMLGAVGIGASNILGIGSSSSVSGSSSSSGRGAVQIKTPTGGEYVDLPEQEWGGSSSTTSDGDSDTWLLVLIGCSVGVLLLGAVLALFVLRCKDVIMLAHRQHQTKTSITTLQHQNNHHNNTGNHMLEHCRTPAAQIKIPRNTDMVLYPTHQNITADPNQAIADNRLLWAALTPRGTQHFLSNDSYQSQRHSNEYNGTLNGRLTPPMDPSDNTYETIENYLPTVTTNGGTLSAPVIQFKNNFKSKDFNLTLSSCVPTLKPSEKSSFDNSGFIDYDYEDPTPLIESYQLNDIDHHHDVNPYAEVEIGHNTHMHQISALGSLRRAAQIRPRISSPTRIENPNMPPLNLHPHHGNNGGYTHRNSGLSNSLSSHSGQTLRRGTLSRRGSDISTFGK